MVSRHRRSDPQAGQDAHQPVDVGPCRSGDHARGITDVRAAASARRAAERLGAIFNIYGTGYVNHFIVVNFTGFKNMVAALGDVQECNPAAFTDPSSGIVRSAGCH